MKTSKHLILNFGKYIQIYAAKDHSFETLMSSFGKKGDVLSVY